MQGFTVDPVYAKGEVFAYVGSIQNLKDLKDLTPTRPVAANLTQRNNEKRDPQVPPVQVSLGPFSKCEASRGPCFSQSVKPHEDRDPQGQRIKEKAERSATHKTDHCFFKTSVFARI